MSLSFLRACSTFAAMVLAFHSLGDRRCMFDVVLAWRHKEPDAIRDGFLEWLRSNRPEIARQMQSG